MKKTVQKPETQTPVPIYTDTLKIEGLVIDKRRFGGLFSSGVTFAQTRDMEDDGVKIIEANDVKRIRHKEEFLRAFSPGECCYVRNSEKGTLELLIVDEVKQIRQMIESSVKFRLDLKPGEEKHIRECAINHAHNQKSGEKCMVAVLLYVRGSSNQEERDFSEVPVVLLKRTEPLLRQ